MCLVLPHGMCVLQQLAGLTACLPLVSRVDGQRNPVGEPPHSTSAHPHQWCRLPRAQVFATAIATWQMGVWNAPSNRGLRASKFFFYDRYHYYQIPKRPIGTVRMER